MGMSWSMCLREKGVEDLERASKSFEKISAKRSVQMQETYAVRTL